MNKWIIGGLSIVLLSTVAVAQENELFPELQGQFKEAAPSKKADAKPAKQNGKNKDVEARQIARAERAMKEGDTGEQKEGNLRIQLQNLEGALPYARTLAYCYGDVVLTNETNQKLDQLALTLTYKDMPTQVSFGGVPKKGTQQKKIMLIGPPCEDILGTPDIEIKACKLGKQSEDACKKRVQFVQPNG